MAAVSRTKVDIAIVAAQVVSGGGTALAMTATHGNLAQLGSALVVPASSIEDSGEHEGDHVSVEGVLLSFTLSGSGGTIVVQKEDHSTITIAVDATTRVNGAHTSMLAELAKATGHKVATRWSAGQEAIG